MECQQGFERCPNIHEVPFFFGAGPRLHPVSFRSYITILLVKYTALRIQCPKKGISPIILFWGWDWDHQSYPRKGSGFLGLIVSLPPSMAGEKWVHFIWPNGIIFHQPRFPWNFWGPISRNQNATILGGHRSCFRSCWRVSWIVIFFVMTGVPQMPSQDQEIRVL